MLFRCKTASFKKLYSVISRVSVLLLSISSAMTTPPIGKKKLKSHMQDRDFKDALRSKSCFFKRMNTFFGTKVVNWMKLEAIMIVDIMSKSDLYYLKK